MYLLLVSWSAASVSFYVTIIVISIISIDLSEVILAVFYCWQKMNPDTRVFHSTVWFNGRKYTSSLWYV